MATPTAQHLVETLLGLPAQLDRIEAATLARRPLDVHIIDDTVAATGYRLTPTELHVEVDGEDLGTIRRDPSGWSWAWSRGNQPEGTWELHRGKSTTREDAVAAVIDRRLDPKPYRPSGGVS